ncbi:uncharacterized [Tachysurus ichikawai]
MFPRLWSSFPVIALGQDKVPTGTRCGEQELGEGCALIIIVQEGCSCLPLICSFTPERTSHGLSGFLLPCFTLQAM